MQSPNQPKKQGNKSGGGDWGRGVRQNLKKGNNGKIGEVFIK